MLWTYFASIVNKRSQIYLGEKSNITNVKKYIRSSNNNNNIQTFLYRTVQTNLQSAFT